MTKKNIIFLSVSLVLIILLGIGVSYSMWNISVSQDTNNTAYTECFDLSITNKGNNINLDNAYPISNDKGKSLTPYTFTVTNTCDITTQYNINLEVLNNSTLSSKFIDVMFEGNINLLSSYDSTDKVNTSSIESRKLTTGILKSGESKDYSLRLWIDYNTTLEDLNNEIKSFKSKIVVVGKPINYTDDTVFNFDYTGGEQTFVAPVSGTYRVELWGAQGGSYNDIYGGYGGYSVGNIILSKGSNVYINVGGTTNSRHGGYNGGGTGSDSIETNNNIEMVNKYLGGGGATHIASASGSLNSLEAEINNILIVSGAGGGGYYYGVRENFMVNGGHGGGYIGNNGNVRVTIGYTPANDIASTGGNQSNGGSGNNSNNYYSGKFGQGGNGSSQKGTGGGSGFYGGGGTYNVGYSSESGAGGSGYIGNPLLKDKVMYCYNCEESNEESTKTISTTCSEETPTSNCAKKGNGYARITLVSIDE